MRDVVLLKNGEEIKRFKVREAFMFDGFRILVDDYRYGKKNASVIDRDGKSDRVFASEELALEFIFNYTDKAMTCGHCDKYEVTK